MIKEYRQELAGFIAAYFWTLIILTIGSHETLQRSVCSVEGVTGGIISPEICDGFLAVLGQVVFSGSILVHITAALTGLLLAFIIYILTED